jgi:hypothetical protein
MYDSIQLGHTADAIERVNGDATDYVTTADMAAQMLTRFPAVRETSAGYAAGSIGQPALDSAVLDALAGF